MELIRGTTPTIDCTIPSEIDMSKVTEIWFTIKQGGSIVVDRTLSDGTINVTGQVISVKLTQEETLKFRTFENAKCGIRLYNESDDTAWASDELEPVIIKDVIKNGIIGGENGN